MVNYRSHRTLFGLPLVHLASGQVVDGRYKRGIARGWIAVGDISLGILFSMGGVACGGISIGGVGLGLIRRCETIIYRICYSHFSGRLS